MKRALVFFVAAILLLGLFSSALADMQTGSMYVQTANGKALRFRSSKSTSGDNVLTEIPYGTKVYVLDFDGTWAKIRYNSAVGYVVQKYLVSNRPMSFEELQAQKDIQKEAAAALKALKAANAKLDHSKVKTVPEYDVTVRIGVEDMTLSLYQKADLTSDVLAEFEEGTRLTVRAANKDWALVYDGKADREGYMLLEDLEEDIMEEELILEDD